MRNKNIPPKPKKLHHWLVSTRTMFMTSELDVAKDHWQNITITSPNKYVNANMIGEAQQMIQVQLMQVIGDPTIKMIDTHIASINYLGEMSSEEFYTPPPVEAATEGAQAPMALDPSDPFLAH